MNNVNIMIILLISLIIQSCEDIVENKEVEVTIINTFTTGKSNPQGGTDWNDTYEKYANIRYTLKNVDSETITGWKIYFNVTTDTNQQIRVGGRFAGTIEPGETSSEKIARDAITAGVGNAVSATVKLVEAW